VTHTAHPVSVFDALADPTRRALLVLLATAERPVVEMAAPFRMSQPAISQHLRVLRRAGLVRSRPAGRKRLYHLEAAPLREVLEWTKQFRHLLDPSGHAWAIGGPSAGVAAPTRTKRIDLATKEEE
jgi:DNA-binding transcriptional ArsR family regulator